MILVTHAITGAAAAALFKQNPVLAFFAAILSHFAIDAIPHLDYGIKSREKDTSTPTQDRLKFNKVFIRDLVLTGFDCGLGILLSLFAASPSPEYMKIALVGAVGGILPDFLQLAYYVFPNSPLLYLQKFHRFIHTKERLKDSRLLGVVSQVAIATAFLSVIVFFS